MLTETAFYRNCDVITNRSRKNDSAAEVALMFRERHLWFSSRGTQIEGDFSAHLMATSIPDQHGENRQSVPRANLTITWADEKKMAGAHKAGNIRT